MEDVPAIIQEIEREPHIVIGTEIFIKASEDIEGKVDALTKTRGQLESLSALSSECCIYRVPERLHEINSKAYTPRLVSIGPFHRGEMHLQAMEEHKLRYLQTFLNRTKRNLEDCFEVVRTWEENARYCYAETIKLSSDEFVEMILVDGSFIVECLLRNQFPKLIDESDRMFNKPWMSTDVCRDMILLENQLPFFVIEGLFNLVSVSIQERIPSFLEITRQFLLFFGITDELPEIVSNPRPRIQHFVDFVRCSYLQSFPQVWRQRNKTYCRPPSVTRLHEAGITFKTKTSCSVFDIKFTNGILEIPSLNINGSTETILRNLIAFEECHCKDKYISQYMKLLMDMIKTSEDVDLLMQHKIIPGQLSSRESTLALLEKICKKVRISVGNFYFTSLSENLNAYCETSWNRWKASMKRDYLNTIFNTPWKILSVILALVILILTIIQTLCSLKFL